MWLQENRILTPIVFTLLLLIVFFVWVNVIVAIISEVYAQECDRSLFVEWDADFPCMALDAPQPENDLDAMVPHQPVHTVAGQPTPGIVALTPTKCAAHPRCCNAAPYCDACGGAGERVVTQRSI